MLYSWQMCIQRWFKMHKLSVNSKIPIITRTTYEYMKNKMKHCDNYLEFIDVRFGLRQWDNMSPLLWALLINDLELCLGNDIRAGMEINNHVIILL